MYEEVWRTQDGREIRVMDMDADHVRAVLNMILRNRRERKQLKRELKMLSVWHDVLLHDEAKWGRS